MVNKQTDKLNTGLTAARRDVARLDEHVIKLLARRFRLTDRIGKLKQASGSIVRDQKREQELAQLHEDTAIAHTLSPALVQKFFKIILEESKRRQRGRTR